ncbi:MAG: hypothetical protein ACI360_08480 [Atopobiaceae bacterium]
MTDDVMTYARHVVAFLTERPTRAAEYGCRTCRHFRYADDGVWCDVPGHELSGWCVHHAHVRERGYSHE